MNQFWGYLLLMIIGIITVIVFLQNLFLSVSVRFLGLRSFPLPLGLAMLLALGVGAIVAILLNRILERVELVGRSIRMRRVAEDTPVIDVEYEDE